MRGEHGVGGNTFVTQTGSSPHARGTPLTATRNLVRGRDHPRMRGEHVRPVAMPPRCRGSSPHARGTPSFANRADQKPGIIPACAGNTFFVAIHLVKNWDHPRMRGEHMSPSKPPWICAGNTRTASSPSISTRDHPRMRGEHLALGVVRIQVGGSSPHARGTRHDRSSLESVVGIIPACAGNTEVQVGGEYGFVDHPRMRGEHAGDGDRHAGLPGSSPHARGTLRVVASLIVLAGIIPACAGNTWWLQTETPPYRDHPRMRGEHGLVPRISRGSRGSSPHARGTRRLCSLPGYSRGIIPACAGNTISGTLGRQVKGDHPRMRGEHLLRSAPVLTGAGSSPHARGTRRTGRTGGRHVGDHPRMRGEHHSLLPICGCE